MWLRRWVMEWVRGVYDDRIDTLEANLDLREAAISVAQQRHDAALDAERRRHEGIETTLRSLVTAHDQDLASLRAVNGQLRNEVRRLQSNWEWASTRLNAVELERATFLQRLLGVSPPVPEIQVGPPGTTGGEPVPPTQAQAKDVASALAKGFGFAGIFEDVGDVEADRLGLNEEPAGTQTTTDG